MSDDEIPAFILSWVFFLALIWISFNDYSED